MKKKGNFRKVVSGLLAGMTTVSYTHLDVYKRQLYPWRYAGKFSARAGTPDR